MRFDVHIHTDQSETSELLVLLNNVYREIRTMSTHMDALTAQVQKNSDAVDSAIVLIQGLRQQIIDAGTDPAKLHALTDSLAQDEQQLAAAVVENTPQS